MRGIWLALVVWGLSLGFVAEALACDPADPFQQRLRNSDLPACAELFIFRSAQSPNITVRNDCDETLRVGGGACSGCEYVVITSSTAAYVSLPAHIDSEEPQLVDVPWRLDGQTGTIGVETTYTEPNSDGCYGIGCRCVRGENRGVASWVVMLLGAAGLGFRRRKT